MTFLKEQSKGSEINEVERETNTEKIAKKTWKEDAIDTEEVRNAINKLKKGKAAEKDSIQNEAQIFGHEEITEELKEILNEIWRKGELPEEWKVGIVKSIFKKENKEEVKNYRGLTLMDTVYKIYAEILRNRLEEY